MAKFSICVVDDSFDDGNVCAEFLYKLNEVDRVTVIQDPFLLLNVLKEESIDVIFMDIEMPGVNGLQLYETLAVDNRPALVLVSHHEQYALEGFKLQAADFIMKPVDFPAVSNALIRALRSKEIPVSPINLPERKYFYCPLKNGISRFLLFQDIIYVEGQGNNCKIRCRGGVVYEAVLGIGKIAAEVPKSYYVRIHNSYVVNVHFVDKVVEKRAYLHEGDALGLGLPMSRPFHADIRRSTPRSQRK